jgi:pimeloyl-ACP methyl ester carboxylesterase
VGEDWGAAIANAVAAFQRTRVQQMVFQETLLPGLPPPSQPDPPMTGGPAGTSVSSASRIFPSCCWPAGSGRSGLTSPAARCGTPARSPRLTSRGWWARSSSRAILEMYRARQMNAEQNRPHYADPISCPVLAVGAQAYLADQVPSQLTQVASNVRGAVITESGHNIALENPAALAQAYLDFFAPT